MATFPSTPTLLQPSPLTGGGQKPYPLVPPQRPQPPAPFNPYATDADAPTLDMLLARQKEAAIRQAQLAEPSAINNTILGGLGTMAGQLFAGLNRARAEREESSARDELVRAISQIDPVKGPTPEQFATIGRRDPDLMMELYSTAIAQRQKGTWEPIATPAGETGQWFRDTVTGKTEKVGGGTEGTGAKLTDISTMRGQFQGTAAFKNLAEAQPMYASLLDAYKRDT